MSGGPLATLTRDAFAWMAGWFNPSTGRGDPERDKRANVWWSGGFPLHHDVLRSLFLHNDLAYAITMALPEWALRHGWDLGLDSDAASAQEIETRVRVHMDNLRYHEKQLYSSVWGQLFGGGLLLIGAVDGRTSDQPLDVENLQRIDWVRPIDRSDCRIWQTYQDPAHANFGQPEIYEVWPRGIFAAAPPVAWHETRLIRYPGVVTPLLAQIQNQGWDYSMLDRVVSKLMLHDSFWDNVGAMVEDGSQGVWKIKGLFNAVVNNMRDQLEARFQIADQTRSNFRALLLDSDGEDFQYIHRQFNGIDGLLAQSAIRTAAAAQIPVTVLFGQSPAGMNATGESDIRLWYDRVEAYQEDVLRPRQEHFMYLLFKSKEGPTAGQEPDGWKLNFRPVRKATPMEEAELRARQAQIDGEYIGRRVVAKEEVAISRFTSEGWSSETQIDIAARVKALKEGNETRLFSQQDMLAVAEIIASVAKGELPKDGAVSLLTLSYPQLDEQQARELVGNPTPLQMPALGGGGGLSLPTPSPAKPPGGGPGGVGTPAE